LELQTAAQLIKNNYPQVSKERIFGHREINTYTTCPSNLFLSTPERKGWKEKLLNLI
jgi:N-acetyl-anhydromuramyl-L-alanine amidase AmpD